MPSYAFTAYAVRKRTGMSGSASADAVIGPHSFTADAAIIGPRAKHNRQLDHYGTILTTSVVLADAIGQYPAGTDVQTVLESLFARMGALETGTLRTRQFTMDAWFQMHFLADAVKRKTNSATFTANADILRGSHFLADAWFFRVPTSSFSAYAYFIDSVDGTWTWATATPNPADGIATVFTIPPYKQGTVQAYIDGVPQTPGVDYTETDDTIGTITFTTPPPFGSVVTVHFIACGG